jgi:hypothetical protein
MAVVDLRIESARVNDPGRGRIVGIGRHSLVWCANLFCTFRLTRAAAALARVSLARISAACLVQILRL